MNEFSFILPGTVTHLSSAVKHFRNTGKGWDLFLRSKSPGLVFSTTYLRGKLAPSIPPPDGRLPPQISREKTAPSRQSLQKWSQPFQKSGKAIILKEALEFLPFLEV